MSVLLGAGLWISLSIVLLLTLCVARGWTVAIDRALLSLLHLPEPAKAGMRRSRLSTAAQDLTTLGGDPLRILFLLAGMVLLGAAGRADTAWQMLLIFASGRLSLFLFKAVARRPRPDLIDHGVATYTTSFPSGHTFMAASFYLAAALLVPIGQPPLVQGIAIGLALVVSLIVAVTRLALGLHWPSDIIVGWFGGIAWTLASVRLIVGLSS